MPREDLLGKRFTRLVVKEIQPNYSWSCLCDCGKKIVVLAGNLKAGNVRSCGCLVKDSRFVKDLTGQKFGRLLVLKRVSGRKRGYVLWECLCDCGTKKILSCEHLRNPKHGGITSCGCRSHLEPGVANRNRVWKIYRDNAKRRGWEWSVTYEEFCELLQGNCYYCGLIPSQICNDPETFGSFVYNGIDRRDNHIGYRTPNLVSCCKTCNHAKCVMSEVEFLSWAERLSKYQSQKQTSECSTENHYLVVAGCLGD